MTAQPSDVSPVPAPGPLENEDHLHEVDDEARRLEREQLLETLPEHLTLNEQDEVVPAEGWVECLLCHGVGVVQRRFPQSGAHMQCPDCAGFGDVMTGSLVQGKDSTMCNTCSGNGYLLKTEWAQIERERREAANAGS